jgi:hypothetical protein
VECLRLPPFELVLERVDEECPELSVLLPVLELGEEGVLQTPPPRITHWSSQSGSTWDTDRGSSQPGSDWSTGFSE